MGTADPAEIARFDALAATWWDPRGPMRELHRMNPARIAWIVPRLSQAGRVLDIGCGAGIAAETLAREGFRVLGVDASAELVAAAEAHRPEGLDLEYRVGTAEGLAEAGERFGAITALEVIEHVPDPGAFLAVLAALLEPGGRLIVSTINRTARSLLTAKLGAEYVLRLLPRGTHDWRRFIAPEELARLARGQGLVLEAAEGLIPTLPPSPWRVGADLRVNYIAAFARA
jgi:2-polyprenyl-6-hydroxyphenyl methylase / 3-demethylubiquinone-9 3-methyltransferase